MSNYTCTQLQEEAFAGVPFADVPEECCRPTPVDPFTYDLHLFGFECNHEIGFFFAVLALTIVIKLFQNFLGTWIGQLERELMQMDSNKRGCLGREFGFCGKWCAPKIFGKLGYLIYLEIIAGIIGVLSILIITGQNAIIWILIILSNATGVLLSLKSTKPDHHSPAAEFQSLVRNATTFNKTRCKEFVEGQKSHLAIQELFELMEEFKKQEVSNIKAIVVVAPPVNSGLKKRLLL